MTAEAARELAARLVEQEMTGRRYASHSKVLVRRAVRDFLRWASRRGTGDVRELGKRDLLSYHGHLCGKKSKKNGGTSAPTTMNARFSRGAPFVHPVLYRVRVPFREPTPRTRPRLFPSRPDGVGGPYAGEEGRGSWSP
jgi:hypothetical protein